MMFSRFCSSFYVVPCVNRLNGSSYERILHSFIYIFVFCYYSANLIVILEIFLDFYYPMCYFPYPTSVKNYSIQISYAHYVHFYLFITTILPIR